MVGRYAVVSETGLVETVVIWDGASPFVSLGFGGESRLALRLRESRRRRRSRERERFLRSRSRERLRDFDLHPSATLRGCYK